MLILLGCCHEVQPVRPFTGWEVQQSKYRALLSSLIEDHGLKAVAEEGTQRECTIAQTIACERGCTYQNLDIDLDTQTRIEVAKPLKVWNGQPHADYPYARAWFLVREYHMYKKYLEFNRDGMPAILICGKLHLAGFQKLFEHWPDLRTICVATDRDDCCKRTKDIGLFDFTVGQQN